ncbi:uncharacterized protein LACBIDRAFT_314820 [Laccaria bicolor S238N-H82]|uniref:Predicted protein n=1 Tax=Laccaria bicolor (strain S238N-H82 / ATCC MYA-4686) TaxID=486041 RepID=B0DZA5_LACBS|nr:uncharacterized protein LACBIDRAFT_314820 [Laccaria bicolor S238N-H82]EDR00082.1 predicted protein [Laccaria bicolor S238N-H82]|eukprot:XP_001889288.1 predicted protein [Laccaria bicolor S238N-H82]
MSFNHGRHQTFADNHINHAGGSIFFINVEQRNHPHSTTLPLEEAGSMATDDEHRRSSRGHAITPAQSELQRGSETASSTPSNSNNPFCANFEPRTSAGTSGCEREVQDERISPLEIYQSSSEVLASSNSSHPTESRSDMEQEEGADCQFEGASVELTPPADALTIPATAFTANNSSFKIYVEHMLPYRYGFPLWFPQPKSSLPIEYQKHGIDIGDVGLITADGSFEYLFNIWRPRDDPLNPQDLPDDFDTFQRPLRRVSGQDVFDPCSALCSGAIKFDTNLDSCEFSLACDCDQGAILCSPEGSYNEDLDNELDVESLILQSAESWYAYALRRGGRLARNQLYFVTGHMKTSSWGIATYDRFMPAPYNVLKFGKAKSPSSRAYVWKETGRATARTGPSLDPTLPRDQFRKNQTLFVRGFKIALSPDAWVTASRRSSVKSEDDSPRVLDAASLFGSRRQNTTAGSSSGHGYRPPGSGTQDSWSLSSMGPSLQSYPPRAEFFHPSDVINELLLEMNPGARVVLTHDKNWFSLVHQDDITLPPATTLHARLVEHFELNCRNGAAVLAPTNVVAEDLQRNPAFTVSQSYQASSVSHDASRPDVAPSICVSESQSTPNTLGIECDMIASSAGKAIFHWNRCEHEKAASMDRPTSASFDGFSDFATGIVSAAELGDMAGIIQSEDLETGINKLSSWIRKPQRHTKTKSFVQLLSQWTANEFELKKWVFFQEKNTVGQPAKPWAVINFRSCVRLFLHGWARKGLFSTKMLFGTEELWWNDLAGRFQISRRKTKRCRLGDPQPIDLRNTEIPCTREEDMSNLPLVTIHKHPNVVAFSISRQNPHDDNETIDTILLASRTFQDAHPDSALHHFGYHSLPAKKRNPLANAERKSQYPSRISPSSRGFSCSRTMNQCSEAVESSFERRPSWVRKRFKQLSPSRSASPRNRNLLPRPEQKLCQDILDDIPDDSPYMLLPLWPGQTDPASSRKYPFRVHIPLNQRLYLLVWYKPDPSPDGTLPKSSLFFKKPSPQSSASSQISFTKKGDWNPLRSHFHFSGRIVGHHQLQGTGIRIPKEGLHVLGPLEEAYKMRPARFVNMYGGAQLGQCFGRDSGMMFNVEALETLDLCRTTPIKREKLQDGDGVANEPALTPLGRSVLEMAWFGGIALTSFASA